MRIFNDRVVNRSNHISQSFIRTLFSQAMSTMYRQEVPQYGVLMDVVNRVNRDTLSKDRRLEAQLSAFDNLNRISEERHGAIRLGKAEELKTLCALFEVMGMYPVGYYDLSVAHMPVHSTAFRPIENEQLQENPFRIFTSLLRVDLIQNPTIVALINEILAGRDIFTEHVKELIKANEKQGGLTKSQAELFVREALETFRWHKTATISYEQYEQLKVVHPLLADIVSFKGPHINHLTPCTLDIDQVQKIMPEVGIDPKAIIEGPPHRKVPILLRQTSFKALLESIDFHTGAEVTVKGEHRARFGEIEQRGAALKPEGMALYNSILEKVRKQIEPEPDGSNAKAYYQVLEREFSEFPDDLATLQKRNLIYLTYRATEKGLAEKGHLQEHDLDSLIALGYINVSPITYEDFLPVSAAGIFGSNLGSTLSHMLPARPDQLEFEKALGRKVQNSFDLYQSLENASKIAVYQMLGIVEQRTEKNRGLYL